MSTPVAAQPQLDFSNKPVRFRRRVGPAPPQRRAPYDAEPGYFEPGGLWLYGNSRLLYSRLAFAYGAIGPGDRSARELDAVEKEAEKLVLKGCILVCGVHSLAHRRAAVVPLRWGSPRIVAVSGGFFYHLGEDLRSEPFRAARLWRYEFDARTDLVVSRRSPNKKPTYACHNQTVDRLIELIARREWPGLRSPGELLCSFPENCKA